MGGLVMIMVVGAVAVSGLAAVRATERRAGMARREFRRAMQGLATSTFGADVDAGGGYRVGPPRGSLDRSGTAALRQRRRAVSLVTIGAACGAVGGAVAVHNKAAAGAAAVAAILAVAYQISVEAIRRRRRAR
jgi:Flp pilus assembly protein TadB